VRWVRDRARDWGADPARLHLVGHSAGAYNAAMLALDPRWLAAVDLRPTQLAGWVGLAGPYDFLPIKLREVQRAFNWPDTPPDSQPLFHARARSARTPPTLLLAARQDDLVDPQRNTVALARALRERGVPVQSELFDRASHTTLMGAFAAPLRGLAPVLDRVSGFVLDGPANRPG
jgi:acetyl esterase/lipase